MAKGSDVTRLRRAYALHKRWAYRDAAADHYSVATVLDPSGGEHVAHECTEGGFWCAGMVGPTVQSIADRLWAQWDRPTAAIDRQYERAERAFTERFDAF